MKYLYYITGFFVIISILIGIELSSKKSSPKDTAIIINDRVITHEEFKNSYEHQQPYKQSKEDFTNSLITKELLIQESRKAGIDKEEPFRRSIQNFYEQSLIKQLIDRKISSLSVEVNEKELNDYIASINKIFSITMFTFDNLQAAEKSSFYGGENRSVSFEDMSGELREKVTRLRTGEHTAPFKSGEKYLIIRLDSAETKAGVSVSESEMERIRAMLIDEKKKEAINNWISSLRAKAKVKIQAVDNSANRTER